MHAAHFFCELSGRTNRKKVKKKDNAARGKFRLYDLSTQLAGSLTTKEHSFSNILVAN